MKGSLSLTFGIGRGGEAGGGGQSQAQGEGCGQGGGCREGEGGVPGEASRCGATVKVKSRVRLLLSAGRSSLLVF